MRGRLEWNRFRGLPIARNGIYSEWIAEKFRWRWDTDGGMEQIEHHSQIVYCMPPWEFATVEETR